MSIELSSTATSLKRVGGETGQGVKGKTLPADAADAQAGAGFLALLTSLGSDAGTVAADALTPASDHQPQHELVPVDMSASAIPQNLPSHLAMLLAQASEVRSDQLNSSGDQLPVSTALPSSAMAGGADSLVPLVASSVPFTSPPAVGALAVPDLPAATASRSAMAGGADSLVPLVASSVPFTSPPAVDALAVPDLPVVTASHPATAGVQAKSGAPTAVQLNNLSTESVGDVQRTMDTGFLQTVQGLPTVSLKTKGTDRQAGVSAVLAESRAFAQSARGEGFAPGAVLSDALLAAGVGDNLLRQADRSVGKPSAFVNGSGVEGLGGQQALTAGTGAETTVVLPDASAMQLESTVAETVSYWVTQGVKHAELKLDGFGDEPLEVRIAIKDGEAHIDFRTDQPEIRQILEGAVTHLKELLKSEGLVLSGVSVGASGQEGAGAQERRDRPNPRQASVPRTETVPTETLHRATQSAGRALDLFV